MCETIKKEKLLKPVVPNWGAIDNTQGCYELILTRFSIHHEQYIF